MSAGRRVEPATWLDAIRSFAARAPWAAVAWAIAAAPAARAQSEEALARQLVNPFTTLVRVPMQLGYDRRIGETSSGTAYSLNIQPLVPFAIDADWTVISRTILTVTTQKEVVAGEGRQSGLGDTLQSFFLAPRKLAGDSVAWGAGIAMLLPTATNDVLGAKKWGLGPTGGVFRDVGPWTIGILANHVWSVAGSGGSTVSSTFVQPAISYTTPDAWSYTLQSEASFDWRDRQWSTPIQASVGKLTTVGNQQMNFEGGVRYWALSPESGPKRWGIWLTVTLLFPK